MRGGGIEPPHALCFEVISFTLQYHDLQRYKDKDEPVPAQELPRTLHKFGS
jgi:hypothetical protein